MELTELTVRSFADLLASNAPAPGGGSTAALEGALGAALSAMVSALTVGRKKYEEHWAFNEDINQKAEALKETFLVAINKDTDAFNAFTAAMAMPKETPEEKAARSAAMQEALIACTESPYHMMELCVNALVLVESQLGKTNTNAMSDLGVAALSLGAAIRGAWLNVMINVGGIKDAALADHYRNDGRALLKQGEQLSEAIYTRIEAELQ